MPHNNASVTFGVFNNDRKEADNHPDLRGRIEITEELLREMVDCRKNNKLPVLEVAGWNSTTKSPPHSEYLYCKVSVSDYWTDRRAKEAEAAAQKEEPAIADDDPFA